MPRPASFGGFTVARAHDVQRFDVSPRLQFRPAGSGLRRSQRPRPAPLAGAPRSCRCRQILRNACAITAAFASGNFAGLRGALADLLHQPFRKKLVPFLDRVIAAAEKAGALADF